MIETKHRFHRNFPLTTVWGYDGCYPRLAGFYIIRDKLEERLK